jgi:hypothetical protein
MHELERVLTLKMSLLNTKSSLNSTTDANLNHEVAVAAGNDGADFSDSTPADVPSAFAVGASDSNDAIASFSNYGGTLGAFAPGVDVISLWNNGETVSVPSHEPNNTMYLSSTRSSPNKRYRIHLAVLQWLLLISRVLPLISFLKMKAQWLLKISESGFRVTQRQMS